MTRVDYIPFLELLGRIAEALEKTNRRLQELPMELVDEWLSHFTSLDVNEEDSNDD